ncbi:MAG: GTPase HflX, partial [Mesorhizobium sp.]
MAREKDADATVRGKPAHHPGTEAEGPTRAVVIVPVLTRHQRNDDETNRPRLMRSADARHDEAVGLARAINLDLIHTAVVT